MNWSCVWVAWCDECRQETLPDDLGRCLWHPVALQLPVDARVRGPWDAPLRERKAA